MLKAMADENLIQWKPSPGLVNETVIATKEYLDLVANGVRWVTKTD